MRNFVLPLLFDSLESKMSQIQVGERSARDEARLTVIISAHYTTVGSTQAHWLKIAKNTFFFKSLFPSLDGCSKRDSLRTGFLP